MDAALRPEGTDGPLPRIRHRIAGASRDGSSGRRSPVFDPAAGRTTAEVDLAGAAEVDLAVAAARAAWDTWRSTSLAHRTRLMFAFRQLVEAHADDVARRITAEHGKVLDDARGEVARGLENIEYACGLAEHLKGSYSEDASRGVDVYTVRRPLGVVAGITPFNFPAMVPLWMFPNAIACGNAFVLKPSERDPSAPTFLAELFEEAGFPPGLLGVVQGDREAVERLLEHRDVAAVSFVGSTPVARHIYETGTRSGKRVQALGGAKNHMVVLPDADLDLAADAAVSAAYGSASDIGPLITAEHRDRVAGYIEAGEREGAAIVVDGRERRFEGPGFFLGPTLLDRVTPDMSVYRDEIFGPVLSVVRAESYPEAIGLLADNPWGNGAAIFTRDGGAARRFQEDADAGMVGINVPIPVPVGYHSFGGRKDSLFGDHAIYGPEGIHFYTRPVAVTARWPDPSRSRVDLGFPTNR